MPDAKYHPIKNELTESLTDSNGSHRWVFCCGAGPMLRLLSQPNRKLLSEQRNTLCLCKTDSQPRDADMHKFLVLKQKHAFQAERLWFEFSVSPFRRVPLVVDIVSNSASLAVALR